MSDLNEKEFSEILLKTCNNLHVGFAGNLNFLDIFSQKKLKYQTS
jgi:hypothetical protein